MWRPPSKRWLCRGCCGANALAKGPRCGPANTNLHTIRTRNTITDAIAGAIQIPPPGGSSLPPASQSQRSLALPAAVVSVAASARSATCDGMNHQDFVLLARGFLGAFTGCHGKRPRPRLGFILGNHSVHFVHGG